MSEDRDTEVRSTRVEVEGEEYVVISYPVAAASLPSSLTPSEREVCRLLLRGLTDAEIATQRGTATRTVANQCRSIYAKLGVRSRSELLTYLARAELDLESGS